MKIDYVQDLYVYGVDEQRFKDAINNATTKELSTVLLFLYYHEITKRSRIMAELNRRYKAVRNENAGI